MSKVILELDTKQVENLVEELPLDDKLALARRLNIETWQLRFKNLLYEIDSRVRKRRVPSDREIVHIVKTVRRRAKHA